MRPALPRPNENPLRRLVPEAGAFLGLLVLAAWLDVAAPPQAEAKPRQVAPELTPKGLRPFDGNYVASLTTAIIALSPFIVVTTAYALFTQQVQQDVHASRTALSIIAGLSTAGYAWGAFLGGDRVLRLRQRHLFFLAEALFALGCLLSAVAHSPPLYAAGRVLSGFATGVLLVAALPPVIQRFPASKLPYRLLRRGLHRSAAGRLDGRRA